MDYRRTWEIAKGFYDGLEEEHCQYFFKYPCWGQPVTCFTIVSMESLKRWPFSSALLGLSWKSEGFKHHQYVRKSLCFCHFTLQSENCLLGTDLLQGSSFKAIFSVPSMSPPPMCHHWTDEMSVVYSDHWRRKCWFTWPLYRSPQAGSAGVPWLHIAHLAHPPGTFHLLKNLCSFLFLYWNNYSAWIK